MKWLAMIFPKGPYLYSKKTTNEASVDKPVNKFELSELWKLIFSACRRDL